MSKFPTWWTAVLLALAAFRIYRLIAKDTILDRPRAWAVGLSGWEEGKPPPPGYREKLAEFLVCPWCLGFWVSLGWWMAWQRWPDGVTIVSVPLAISCFVGLVSGLDRE